MLQHFGMSVNLTTVWYRNPKETQNYIQPQGLCSHPSQIKILGVSVLQHVLVKYSNVLEVTQTNHYMLQEPKRRPSFYTLLWGFCIVYGLNVQSWNVRECNHCMMQKPKQRSSFDQHHHESLRSLYMLSHITK